MDKLRQIPKRLLEIWNKYTKKQKTIIISSVAVIAIALGLLVFIIQRPNMVVLTQSSSYNEMSQVTKLLTDNGYTYTTDDKTMTIKVDNSKLTDAKMLLASSDIKASGYSLEDALASSFSTTETDKQHQWQSYLETKFSTDLKALDGVKGASVTVVLPDSTNTFYSTKAEASVSAVLNLDGKTMDEDRSISIAQFLATSVGNSNTNKITIISTSGETLFSGADSAVSTTGSVGLGSQQKYQAQIETTIKTSLRQSLLSTKLFDDAQISMHLSLDWAQVTEIATKYTAQEGREEGLFSKSSITKSTGANGSGGVAGTSSNDSDTTYNVTDGGSSTSTYSVENLEYLPDVIVTTTNNQPGKVILTDSSITVTLVKNVIYNETEAKTLGYLNGTTWDEFKAANATSKAVTVDANWMTAISTGTGISTKNITVLAYQVPFFVDAEATNVTQTVTFWLQIALAVIIIGILAFVIIRSAKPLTVEEKEPELSVEEMLATTKEVQQAVVEEIGVQEKSETRKAIEKFVDENPEAVALLLRNWLNEGWE